MIVCQDQFYRGSGIHISGIYAKEWMTEKVSGSMDDVKKSQGLGPSYDRGTQENQDGLGPGISLTVFSTAFSSNFS